jgi:uncharacterized membrane protein YkvA (DUF1232 family)
MAILETIKQKARALKKEIYALYYAARDNRTPWYAKGLILFTVAYAMSPVDLIPDFIPVLGYLDDLIIIPACIALCLRLIPGEVMATARQRAHQQLLKKESNWIAGGIIIFIWLLMLYFIGYHLYCWYERKRIYEPITSMAG